MDVGQLRVVADLQFDHSREIVEGPALHHQKLLHVVEAAGRGEPASRVEARPAASWSASLRT